MTLFRGRTTVITGASRGIGRAIALQLAEEGSDLVLVARGSEALEQTGRDCADFGVRAEILPLDLADPGGLESAVQARLRSLSRIDHLVNNAGVTRDGLLMRMKLTDWDAVLSVNLTAAFLVTRAVVPAMIRAHFGRIVNISSVVGMMGNPGQVNYCASKAGLLGFTVSLAREVAPRNITVNAIAPGFIDTELTAALPPAAKESLLARIPLGRMGTPGDVAEGVRFLLSDAAAYITGSVLNISGGLHMA